MKLITDKFAQITTTHKKINDAFSTGSFSQHFVFYTLVVNENKIKNNKQIAHFSSYIKKL